VEALWFLIGLSIGMLIAPVRRTVQRQIVEVEREVEVDREDEEVEWH
jgi:hypothetical protein